MPPFGILPALALSLTVAVWLVDGAAAGGRFGAASTLVSAGVAGWWWGFGYFVAGLWWLGSAFLVEADQFAWALPFGVLGLPALLAVFPAARLRSCASLLVARRRAALRFRLRPDRLGMAARHSLHRLPVEHDRHGARPEPLADAGGLGDRALRPDDPRHPDLRGAGDARDRRRRIAPLGGAWPCRFGPRAPRRVRSLARAARGDADGRRGEAADHAAEPAAGRQVQAGEPRRDHAALSVDQRPRHLADVERGRRCHAPDLARIRLPLPASSRRTGAGADRRPAAARRRR